MKPRNRELRISLVMDKISTEADMDRGKCHEETDREDHKHIEEMES
jgi:hypothetical protein